RSPSTRAGARPPSRSASAERSPATPWMRAQKRASSTGSPTSPSAAANGAISRAASERAAARERTAKPGSCFLRRASRWISAPVTRRGAYADVLLPVTLDPVPAAAVAAPVAADPARSHARADLPAAPDPDVGASVPGVMTGDPDVLGARRDADHLDLLRWRS